MNTCYIGTINRNPLTVYKNGEDLNKDPLRRPRKMYKQ